MKDWKIYNAAINKKGELHPYRTINIGQAFERPPDAIGNKSRVGCSGFGYIIYRLDGGYPKYPPNLLYDHVCAYYGVADLPL